MIYLKINNKYLTLKEIAIEYNVNIELLRGRYRAGIRDLNELIAPKHNKWNKD